MWSLAGLVIPEKMSDAVGNAVVEAACAVKVGDATTREADVVDAAAMCDDATEHRSRFSRPSRWNDGVSDGTLRFEAFADIRCSLLSNAASKRQKKFPSIAARRKIYKKLSHCVISRRVVMLASVLSFHPRRRRLLSFRRSYR